MIALITHPFFLIGFFAALVLSFFPGLWLYEKLLRKKLEQVIVEYKKQIEASQVKIQSTYDKYHQEMEELAKYKEKKIQDIIDEMQKLSDTIKGDFELKEDKLQNIVVQIEQLYNYVENESQNIKSNINELHRLREKNEKLVATNRQLNERLTKKKRQLRNLRGGNNSEN